MTDIEALFKQVMDQAFKLHEDVGPGLLETVYETVLADRLRDLGHRVYAQRPIDISIDEKQFRNAFRADLIVDEILLVEIKSVENLSAVHIKQTLTYIRLLNMPLGMLVNFGGNTFKGNIKRIMNDKAST